MISFEKLIECALGYSASHLYLIPNNSPAIKRSNQIEFLQIAQLTSLEIEEIVKYILSETQYNTYKKQGIFETIVDFDETCLLKIYITHNQFYSQITIHILKRKAYSLSELEIPQDLYNRVINAVRGLILITGPSHSGKTTTMISIIDEINNSQKKHILIFGDNQVFDQRSYHSLISVCGLLQANFSFIKKQAADIVFFSDFSNIKLIKTAINCVETGHLVVASIDAVSIQYAIERVVSFFSDRDIALGMLSTHLTGIMMQVLVKKKNNEENLCLCDFVQCNDEIQDMIRTDQLQRIDNCNIVKKIDRLINKGYLDYYSAKITLEKLGILNSYDNTQEIF